MPVATSVATSVATPIAASRAARALSGNWIDADRVRATWIGWDKCEPSEHPPVFNLERKRA
jgi:hypothetical protein